MELVRFRNCLRSPLQELVTPDELLVVLRAIHQAV